MLSHKYIILDRDGVINRDTNYVYKIKDFIFRKNVLKALRYLNKNKIPFGKGNLISRAINTLKKVKTLDNIVISSDDDEILALFLQPKESADEHHWWW